MGVKCTPASSRVVRAQKNACLRRHGEAACWALVCMSCGTWRDKSKGVSGVSKATSGVVADLGTNRYACNACSADWSVYRVNVVGAVISARVRMTTSPACIMVCCKCGVAASPIVSVGAEVWCTACADAAETARRCRSACALCGSDVKGAHPTECYSSVDRSKVSIPLCRRHSAAVRRLTPAITAEDVFALPVRPDSLRKPAGRVRVRHARVDWKRRVRRWDEGLDP